LFHRRDDLLLGQITGFVGAVYIKASTYTCIILADGLLKASCTPQHRRVDRLNTAV
jgi:hypothetical protein